ncbi:MAG: DUF1003 domain-containing protein [Nanoarchaeota archaeon]|nr:DUF1003 domain-containing protein [Nanoarchaeota archaeon]
MIKEEVAGLHIKEKHPVLVEKRTLGQRAADRITASAGSWTFILIFFGFIIMWVTVNTAWIIFGKSWDPYPFILLNLALSCLASIQAPMILMSQNREAQKDRIRAHYDYAVNRKAEKEVKGIIEEIREIKKLLGRKR